MEGWGEGERGAADREASDLNYRTTPVLRPSRRLPNIMNAARLFFPVVVGACLCGCASERSNVSTENEEAHTLFVRKVDYSATPEMKELAEHTRRVGNEMYPKVLALLADDTAKLPHQFDIVFRRRLEGNFGQTVGATINLRAEWFAKNPTDLDETLIHEMSHVAHKYPSKAWDYWGEGIADYVCYKLGYTNEWNWPHCSFEYPHYTSGYCCAGAFLMFVDATYGSNVVRELNAELRRGSYSDSFFAKATGKSLDALWTEFQKTPAFMPVAAETLQLQAELGYVNGQPPKDIGRRLTS